MSVEAAKIVINVSADGAAKATTQMDALDKSVAHTGISVGHLESSMAGLAGALGSLALVSIARDAIKAGLAFNKSAEQARVSFEVMTGSASEAEKTIKSLRDFAASTPFAFNDIQNATKTLMQFGVSAGKATDIVKMLGDASGGNAERMQRMANAFGKASSQGKLTGEVVQQMIEAGFNPLNFIAQKTGETMSDLQARMSKGAVGVSEMTGAFTTATSAGGPFFNMLKKQSETLEGLESTAKDAMDTLGGAMTEGLVEPMKMAQRTIASLATLATEAIGEFNKLPAPIKNSIMVMTSLAVIIPAVGTALVALGPVINMVKIAMLGMGGPVVIALTAVVVAVTAITTAIMGSIKAQEDFNSAMQKTSNLSKQAQVDAIDAEKMRVSEQITTLRRLAAAEERQFGMRTFQSQKYNDEIIQLMASQGKMSTRQQELNKEIKAEAAALKGVATASIILSDSEKDRMKSIDEILKAVQEEYETYGLSNSALIERKLKLKGASDGQIAFASSVQTGIDALKSQTEAQKNATKEAEDAASKQKDAQGQYSDLLKNLEDEAMKATLSAEAYKEYAAEKQKAADVKLLESTGLSGEELDAALEKLQGLRAAASDAGDAILKAFAEAQPYINAAAAALGSIQQLIQNIGDEQLMRAEEELAKNQEIWDDKLAKAESEGATTEQVAELKKQAAADLGRQEEALDAKRRQSQHDNAILSKSIALLVAAVNAPAAIIKALADGGIPLAIAVGVATAAQIAAIAATPIPAAQFGGDFVVPPGATGDSGLLRVNSGEQVSVTPVRDSGGGGSKTMVLSIGGREFDAYMEEQVGNAMNSGRVTVRRSGVVRA